jgi:phosphoserine phosphatase
MPADVLALFDLDHTLLPNDSDEQWVAFLVEEGALDRARYDAANHELIARYNRGEAGAIEFTEFYLSTLMQFDEAELLRWREGYLNQKVRPRITPAARALVERHRRAGDLVVVTTAVFRFLPSRSPAEFGISDVIATEAERLARPFHGPRRGCPEYAGRQVRSAGQLAWPSADRNSPIFASHGSTAIR